MRCKRRIGEQWTLVSGSFFKRRDKFLRSITNHHQLCVPTLKILHVVIEVGNLPTGDHSSKMADEYQNNSFIFPQGRQIYLVSCFVRYFLPA